jgi:cell wall assembly regulator SMI1
MTTVQSEFERLRRVFENLGTPFTPAPPATNEQISAIRTQTGIDVSSDLVELWRISNGSNGVMWFAEGDDEFTPYYFLSTSDVIETWKRFEPYDAEFYEQWIDDEDDGSIRGPNIQPRIVRHQKWLSFAEFNGGSHSLLFDSDPTPSGSVGQIINFIHDPDGVTWTSKSFTEFFTRSNDILCEWLDSPDELREQLWIWG